MSVIGIWNAVRNDSESLIAQPSLSWIMNIAIPLKDVPLVTCYPLSQEISLPTTRSLRPL
jgi:hypothetical protein